MIKPNLTTNHPDFLDRIFYQSSNGNLGIVLTIPEYHACDDDINRLVGFIAKKPKHDIDDILDFLEDHQVAYAPYTYDRPYGPPPLRISLPDAITRYRFWLKFPS